MIEVHRRLFDRGAGGAPAAVETSALGAMLHSFYNGVENIFKRVALELDGELRCEETFDRLRAEVLIFVGSHLSP